MNKPILVVGGAGYIGSHVARRLKSRGYIPVILDNLSTGHREAATRATDGGPFYLGSYADSDLVGKILVEHKIECVMHFGAKALVGESCENPHAYYTANVSNTLNLLHAMLKCGVKNFIFSSTCAVYGQPEVSIIDETTLKNPINPYGRSKLFVEQILKDFDSSYGMHSGILRYFNAAGADLKGDLGEDHRPETHLIPNIFKVVQGIEQKLIVNGNDYPTPDGSCIRDYIHVNDLAEAHLRMLDYIVEHKKSLDVNLGVGRGYSIFEVIQAVERVTGKKIPLTIGSRRSGDPGVLVANPKKAQTHLQWTAEIDMHGIVNSVHKWVSEYPKGYGNTI